MHAHHNQQVSTWFQKCNTYYMVWVWHLDTLAKKLSPIAWISRLLILGCDMLNKGPSESSTPTSVIKYTCMSQKWQQHFISRDNIISRSQTLCLVILGTNTCRDLYSYSSWTLSQVFKCKLRCHWLKAFNWHCTEKNVSVLSEVVFFHDEVMTWKRSPH